MDVFYRAFKEYSTEWVNNPMSPVQADIVNKLRGQIAFAKRLAKSNSSILAADGWNVANEEFINAFYNFTDEIVDFGSGGIKDNYRDRVLETLIEFPFLKQFSGFQFMAGVKLLNLNLGSPEQREYRSMVGAKDAPFSKTMGVSYSHFYPVWLFDAQGGAPSRGERRFPFAIVNSNATGALLLNFLHKYFEKKFEFQLGTFERPFVFSKKELNSFSLEGQSLKGWSKPYAHLVESSVHYDIFTSTLVDPSTIEYIQQRRDFIEKLKRNRN